MTSIAKQAPTTESNAIILWAVLSDGCTGVGGGGGGGPGFGAGGGPGLMTLVVVVIVVVRFFLCVV